MNTIFFPPEWHPQSAVQMTWPHIGTDWSYMLDEVTECFVAIAKEILSRQKLIVVCNDSYDVMRNFTERERRNLITAQMDTNDTWARDHAGISVFINDKPCVLDFGFNGWGLKFAANYDNQITQELFRRGVFNSRVRYINHISFILEGGSIESDGKGTLLTSAQCLLAPNRNQPMQRRQIESYLKHILGMQRVLWIEHGYLAGDDTDSHIDTLARFCNDNTIAYVQCTDDKDEHYEQLCLMEEELQSFVTPYGKPYNLIALPMADAQYDTDNGQRLPATYANFLIINGAVLMPAYGSQKDEIAKQQLQKAFPTYDIVAIDCRPLIRQHGSLHCVTMQIPEKFI